MAASTFIPIPNQPFSTDILDEVCISGDQKGYCQKLTPTDILYFQWKQDACDKNYLCDSDFSEVGVELATNPDFTGSAAGWTLGAGWAYGTDEVCHSAGTAKFYQAIGGMIVGKTYLIEYTITNRTTGMVASYVGGTAGTSYDIDGNYLEYVNAGNSDNDFGIVPTTDFDGCITLASIKEVSPCWQAIAGENNLNFSSGMVCHIVGVESTIENTTPLFFGSYNFVTITITGMTQGKVTVFTGTNNAILTDNGTFTLYLEADATNFDITMDADFDGCITEAGVNAASKSWLAELYDANGVLAFIFTVDYLNEYCFINTLMSDTGADEGCYTIQITDACSSAKYSTNCMDYRKDFPCTKLVQAVCGGVNMGFNFDANFVLQQRLEVLRFNPNYQTEQELFIQSNGEKKLISSQREKFKVAQFNYIDEIALDCLSTQLLCSILTIDGVEFVAKKDNLTPNWDKTGTQKLAQLVVELSEQGTVIFNHRCT